MSEVAAQVHQEMYRDLCGDATPKAIRGWWDKRMPDGTRIDPIIAPGGFSECCFADAADTENEYLYLKGRQGVVVVPLLVLLHLLFLSYLI